MEFAFLIYYSPLHYASKNGRKKIVKLFLKQAEINVNLQTKIDCLTPLHFAVQNNYIEVVILLISHSKIQIDIKDNAFFLYLYGSDFDFFIRQPYIMLQNMDSQKLQIYSLVLQKSI